MTDYSQMTKEELVEKLKEYKQVLDRRPEARFARWVENGAFAAGVAIVVLSAVEIPFLDISAFELTLAFVMMSAKMFGKTVAVDILRSIFTSTIDLSKTLTGRNKRD